MLKAQLMDKNHNMEITVSIPDQNIETWNLEINKEEIKARIEGQLSKMVSDQISLQFRDKIDEIIQNPEFNLKVQEHVLKLVDNCKQVTFRKIE